MEPPDGYKSLRTSSPLVLCKTLDLRRVGAGLVNSSAIYKKSAWLFPFSVRQQFCNTKLRSTTIHS
jgi:hypothetical protein